jgi:hypothetical protein
MAGGSAPPLAAASPGEDRSERPASDVAEPDAGSTGGTDDTPEKRGQ